MGQYQEGQHLLGSDGRTYVVRNGTPVSVSPSPLISSPTLPGQLQAQSDTHARTQQEIRQAEATAGATTREKTAQATKAEIDAKTAQEQWNITHPTANGAEALSGPAYMQQLQKTDPGRAAYIQGLAEGRVPFPGPQMMRSPAGMALLNQVMRADPTIDATNYATRAAARKNAAVGQLSQSDNAMITAVGHIARLNTLAPEVWGTKSTLFNSVANSIDKNWFGGAQPAYEQNQQLAGNELAGAYGAKTEGKQNEGASQFDENYASGQKTNNISGAVDLLMSKLAANRAQFAYGNGGLSKPDFMLLPPGLREQVMSIPGGKEAAAKYFAGIPVMGQNGGNQPPPGSPPANGGGFAPPPTGPTGGLPSPSSNGFDNGPDPQSSTFWSNAIRQGTPYREALQQWQSQLGGKSVVTPPDPDKYAQAVSYVQKHPNTPYSPVESLTRTPIGPVQAVTNAVAQNPVGAFATHAGNAALGNVPTLLAGDRGALFNAVSGQQNPKASSLGDLAGTVAGMVGAGKAVGAVAPSLGRFGRALTANPLRQGLVGDIAYGTAAGSAGNPDHPILGGTLGGLSAAGGNIAGRYILGPALRAGGETALGQKAVNLFRSPDAPFSAPSALNSGQSTVLGQANKGGIDDITGKLNQAQDLGLPYALADADPRLRMLAGSAVRKSPDVYSLAESVLIPRQAGQGERAIGQINSNLAPVGDVPSIQASLLKMAQAKSAPLYDAAKSQPVPDLTKNPALAEVLDRPAGQTAIRHGFETALNKGEDVGTLTYATDPSGNTVASGNPSWNVIHYARQALDANGDTDVRQALDKQIATINPGFKKADAAYSGVLKGSDALQAGSDATGIKVTPEATQNALTGFPNHGPQFQQGYASNLADQIERQRFAGNPYNLVNGSMGQQAKLGSVFPDGAARFNNAQALEGDMGKTYQEALGGSPTQPRAEADKMFTSGDAAEAGLDLAGVAATGGSPLGLLPGLIVRKGTDAYRLGMGRAKADAIGPLLFNTDPQANLTTLGDLMRMNTARQQYVNQARSLGGLVGAPMAYGLTQNN